MDTDCSLDWWKDAWTGGNDFFIPLVAVFYALVQNDTNGKLEKRYYSIKY